MVWRLGPKVYVLCITEWQVGVNWNMIIDRLHVDLDTWTEKKWFKNENNLSKNKPLNNFLELEFFISNILT